MKAVETNFLTFLQQPKQFLIPIYQRTYSWEITQCQQLWRDITRAGADSGTTGHFVGSVVYIAESSHIVVSLIPKLLVIDGQQRLTTVSLLLAVFAHALEKRSVDVGISKQEIEHHFLFNAYGKDDLRYKLLLTRSDKETLMRLIEGKGPPAENPSPHLVENYRYFANEISKLSDDSLKQLYAGIQKLMIVDISLNREHDNAQLIFESLNATALALNAADLIRNYILMGLEPQEQTLLYEEYWYPIEQGFANSGWFDFFIRDYLTFKTGAIPNIRDIYATFKTYVQSNKTQTLREIVDELHRFAGYYVRLTQEKEPDTELRSALHDLNTLRVDVARPFLLSLFEDLDNDFVDKQTVLKVLRLIESYVFRRAICGVPTNTLSKTFAVLNRAIEKSNYFHSLQEALVLMESYRRFPADEEFKQELKIKDVYNFRVRNYLLTKLENDGHKEWVNVENYTIEHVLPQNPNLRLEWRTALGDNWKEVQQRVLHTLGNLTLTGYNSEYGDRPFAEKRDMMGGFKDSPLWLNQVLRTREKWDEAEIAARAETLAEKAVGIWQFPTLPNAVLTKYKPPVLDDASLADFPALEGNNLSLFNEFRRRIENLDASVQMTPRKRFIGFDAATNFVSIIPYKSGLRVVLNLHPEQIQDPKKLCRAINNIGHWGKGDLDITELVNRADQLDDTMNLVRQAFEHHSDEQENDESDAYQPAVD